MLRLSPVLAIRLVFALNALGLAVWLPRIPDVKAALDVGLFTLSMCFLMLPVGTVVGFLAVPSLIARFGQRQLCRWGGALFILLFALPAMAASPLQLGAALLLCGLGVGTIEVAMNAKVPEIEALTGRRIMSSCHGFWSMGSMTGALLGGAAAGLGVGFLAQQLVLAPIFAAIAFAVAGALPADRGAEAHVPTKGLRLPQGILLAVCLVPMGALMIEGAMMEWSALFLRGDVGLGAFQAAAVFAVFEVAMAAARLSGDRLIERLGAHAVLAASAVIAALGVLVFALSPGLGVAMAGATLTGLGIANIYPLAMSRAAEIPGPNPENNIATVAFAAFTIYLVSPPLIGTLGSALGLTMAFALLAPAAIYPLFMLRATLSGRVPAAS